MTLVQYPDPELLVKSYLDDELAYLDPAVTTGVGVPSGWTKSSPRHLQIESDGTPEIVHPIVAYTTVRVVAWATDPTPAKELASRAMGHLLAHPGDDDVSAIRRLTGVLPARDPETKAELAAFTVRVGLRSQPIDT